VRLLVVRWKERAGREEDISCSMHRGPQEEEEEVRWWR